VISLLDILTSFYLILHTSGWVIACMLVSQLFNVTTHTKTYQEYRQRGKCQSYHHPQG
jgi:hypothetical protein